MNEQHQETFHVLLLGENKIIMSYVLFLCLMSYVLCRQCLHGLFEWCVEQAGCAEYETRSCVDIVCRLLAGAIKAFSRF